MTPRQIHGIITAHAANMAQERKNLDLLAWMTGYYTARGYSVVCSFNGSEKYPDKPCIIKDAPETPDEEPMPDETMKEMLTAFAEIHNRDVIKLDA
jgi:hypothetical protein